MNAQHPLQPILSHSDIQSRLIGEIYNRLYWETTADGGAAFLYRHKIKPGEHPEYCQKRDSWHTKHEIGISLKNQAE